MATFGDLKAFVEADGWQERPNLVRARRRTGDHRHHSKRLPDGRVLRIRVSHGLPDEIGHDLFHVILRSQLEVDEVTFWAGIHGAVRPTAAPAPDRPAPIPGWLVQRLLLIARIPEEQVARMTPDDAAAAWEAYQRGRDRA